MAKALNGMLDLLEKFRSVLLSESKPSTVFTTFDQKTLQDLYYSHAVSLSAHWETVRLCGVTLCGALSDADAAAEDKRMRLLDPLVHQFFELEQAVQVFMAENEAMIHQKDHSLNKRSMILSIQILSFSIRQFKDKLEACAPLLNKLR